MPTMPAEYLGREQTWLKHRVLKEYLDAWSRKIGSIKSREVHLWYVDVFAGPWKSKSVSQDDTSIAIGLKALNEAAKTWESLGNPIHLHAAFVEKDERSYKALNEYVKQAHGAVAFRTFHGTFAQHAPTINRLIGTDPAFIFVDPTGWHGAPMRSIALLGKRKMRDLMINVMYDHINRFKDDERGFLRNQMRDFFGLTDSDLPAGMGEEELMRFYRHRLRDQMSEQDSLPYVADLAIPVPDKERTNFRLVVAGRHPKVLELFRVVEAKVIGHEAAQVRSDARAREKNTSSGQLTLLQPSQDSMYAKQRNESEKQARQHIKRTLKESKPVQFGKLWPEILLEEHLTLSDLRKLILEMEKQGVLEVIGRQPGERTVKDEHLLALKPNTAG